jgi:hypothetical protein
MSKAWEGGSTRAWRRTRAAVLARDGYRCRAHPDGWCDRAGAKPHTCTGGAPLHGGPGVAGHAHHTQGRAAGDEQLIVAACPSCNLAIGEPANLNDRPIEGVTKW